MPPRLPVRGQDDRLLTIFCEGPAHGGRRTTIARFREEVSITGERVNVDMVRNTRRTRSGVELWTAWTAHERLDPDGHGHIAPDPHPPSALLTLVDETGTPTSGEDRLDEDDSKWYWRYQFRCPTCGLNVPARSTRLLPVLYRLFDADVSTIKLSALAARVR